MRNAIDGSRAQSPTLGWWWRLLESLPPLLLWLATHPVVALSRRHPAASDAVKLAAIHYYVVRRSNANTGPAADVRLMRGWWVADGWLMGG